MGGIGDPIRDFEYFEFFQDGCAAMARNSRLLLHLAGETITAAAILEIVGTAPRRMKYLGSPAWKLSRCSVVPRKAFDRCKGTHLENLMGQVMRYFVNYLPRRPRKSREMLDSAFLGILGAVDWDEIAKNFIPLLDEMPPWYRRGPIERWAARRGL